VRRLGEGGDRPVASSDQTLNSHERWTSQAAVETFRGNGPSDEQGAAMRSVSVAEYDIADVRPLFGAGTA
jgi:hypothetical protein